MQSKMILKIYHKLTKSYSRLKLFILRNAWNVVKTILVESIFVVAR